MRNDLLHIPERPEVETALKAIPEAEAPLSFEYLMGYLTGAALTPGLLPSQWLPSITGRLTLDTLADAEVLVGNLMRLYNRINEQRLGNRDLCPFDKGVELAEDENFKIASEWASGLNAALLLGSEVWVDEEGASLVPSELKLEVAQTIPLIWAIAAPQDIPEIAPDPRPFQKNLLSKAQSWQEELRESWDEDLIEMFQFFCMGRLSQSVETLQRFSLAYGKLQGRVPNAPASAKIGRNDPCPCGSGKKYKKCCGA